MLIRFLEIENACVQLILLLSLIQLKQITSLLLPLKSFEYMAGFPHIEKQSPLPGNDS